MNLKNCIREQMVRDSFFTAKYSFECKFLIRKERKFSAEYFRENNLSKTKVWNIINVRFPYVF